MTEPDRTTVENALEAAYQNISTVADGLGEAELMLPSLCAGWALGDVVYHQPVRHGQRQLHTAGPAARPGAEGHRREARARKGSGR
jgi:hypothetical protein